MLRLLGSGVCDQQGGWIRKAYLVLVACALIGLMGQLTLQSRGLPDEMPRATFERLTGLQIGPADSDVTDVVMMDNDMPDMKMASMSDMSERWSPFFRQGDKL